MGHKLENALDGDPDAAVIAVAVRSDQAPFRQIPLWVFFVAMATIGIPTGYIIGLSRILESQLHIPIGRLAALSALTYLPWVWRPLWTPITDLWLRRKHWYMVLGITAAVGTLVTFCIDPRQHFRLFAGMLLFANAAAVTSGTALEAMAATMVQQDHKGRVSGFLTAGLLVTTALSSCLVLLLREPPSFLTPILSPLSMPLIGALLAGLLVVCMLPVLRIFEPPARRGRLLPLLKALLRDTRGVLRTPLGWTGLLICLSPVCTSAASSLFGAIASDFHATPGDVLLMTGPITTLASAAGAFLGGPLADRLGPRRCLCLSSGLLATCGLLMAWAPAIRSAYLLGALCYLMIAGLAYSAFYAMVFEIIEHRAIASTTFSVFTGASSLSYTYMAYLVGQAYEYAPRLGLSGRVGLLAGDGLLNILGFVLVGTVVLLSPARSAQTEVPHSAGESPL